MLRVMASLVPGRADAAGTAQYAQKVAFRCGTSSVSLLNFIFMVLRIDGMVLQKLVPGIAMAAGR
jgi:hypothetical protein